jgi:cell division protein FtsB
MRISGVKAAYALVVICGLAYAFQALRGPSGVPGLIEKRLQVEEYESANQQLQREIEQKQERIHRLESDPEQQELEIRQRLKLAGHSEKIYIFDDKKPASR